MRRRSLLDAATIGRGPADLDCELARLQGWTEKEIETAWAALSRISARYARRAQARFPELYAVWHGVAFYIGKLPKPGKRSSP